MLLGLGAGAFAQSGFAIIQAIVAPAEMANAITFIVSIPWYALYIQASGKALIVIQIIGQLSGITFGLAIAGSVFLNASLRSLEGILPTASPDELQQLIAGTSSNLLDGLDETTRATVLNAVVLALRKV